MSSVHHAGGLGVRGVLPARVRRPPRRSFACVAKRGIGPEGHVGVETTRERSRQWCSELEGFPLGFTRREPQTTSELAHARPTQVSPISVKFTRGGRFVLCTRGAQALARHARFNEKTQIVLAASAAKGAAAARPPPHALRRGGPRGGRPAHAGDSHCPRECCAQQLSHAAGAGGRARPIRGARTSPSW